jgi:hypothetical protein
MLEESSDTLLPGKKGALAKRMRAFTHKGRRLTVSYQPTLVAVSDISNP